jgi:hypothetical protein
MVLQAFEHIQAYCKGFHFFHSLTKASDEYYTSKQLYTAAWDTTFVIPDAAIDSDAELFQNCNRDFSQVCRHKQALLSSNRLSVSKLHSIFSPDGTRIPEVRSQDYQILCDFAEHGIIPPVSPSFKP